MPPGSSPLGIVVKRTTGHRGCCEFERRAALARPACQALAIAGLITGCGSGESGPAPQPVIPPPAAVTAVTMVLTSTANDQLTEFDIEFEGMSLTSASGKKVTVLPQARQSEMIHVNGAMEPLATTTVPQDVYTAATVTVGGAQFMCIAHPPNAGLTISTFAYGQTPTTDVTVTLPSPIVVSGETMGLALNMQVSHSASYTSCAAGGSYAITPAFSLSAFALSSQRAPSANGGVAALDGEVTALDSASTGFQISLPGWGLVGLPGTSVHVTTAKATIWQGIAAFTDLHAGMFVDLDGAIQADGSIAATRIAVADPAAVNVERGPLLFVSNAVPILVMYPRQAQGMDPRLLGDEQFSFNGSTFLVSGQFSNLPTLPFTPSFTAETMVPGQAVYVSSPAFVHYGPYSALATTITLAAQTINGTVFGLTSSGDFTVYSVSLASYDLFPLLATQAGQTTLLTNPGVIEVYADTNTVVLTSPAPALGDTLRFYGLVFNDHGTLRMDCAQISAGVNALSQ